ncbi:protein PHYTOCHROME KINASE SUBSTRATE 1 [Corylus avellana]|uniref:protein PHYTOCHROME KINASE SUBSTRATE 1 n=1 Tax=Corylus avellana TaxID=13451 RepID=UPI001E21D987|nr:protein PHYTOCHROME KINASE SUBSTRATE 1 [Corylus avellana]
MAVVTLTSSVNTSPSPTLPFGNDNTTLREASFSAYLNGTEEAFVRKLADHSSRSLMAPHEERKKEDDEEIGVFGAEKYFKGGLMDEDNPRSTAGMSAKKHQYKKAERVDLEPIKCRIQPLTPSVQSESSWNSQSSLLQSGVRNPSRTNTNKVRRKKILAGLGCKYCSCSDKDSVEIKEHGDEISFQGKAIKTEPRKTDDLGKLDKLGDRVGLNRENCFTFPTSNSGAAGNLPITLQFQEDKEEKLRKSIEVFGSPVMGKRNKSLSIERRLTMLSWDATPRLEEIDFSAPSGGTYNDTESDASSDLFEIESLTGKANPFLARQASDATSGCVTPTTCYEPSEASIEWSVVTASAADFSVMSDCEELRSTSTKKGASAITNAKAETNREIQRRRSGILLGCKSQKAVQVAGDAYRSTNEKANVYPSMHRRPDSFVPVTRFRAETMSTGFSSRQGQHRSLSPRASHLLYIQ